MSWIPTPWPQPIAFLVLLSLPVSATQGAEERNGFPLHSVELTHTLAEALRAKGPNYEPRTEHLAADGAALYTNRLILEASPYLVQHAHNPVDWYPWGEEAFERARREDRPVFLSIGYSTCHWCHVMERESFDNETIAELMNELFVCIKVDREQRPDLDEIYMTALQLTGQRGGWPMSSFLTPDRDPFYGGTYFPPTQFAELLRRVDTVWREQREEIVARAQEISAAVRKQTSARGEAVAVGEAAIAQAVRDILARNDPKLGGPRGAPKFPHEPELLFLIDQARRAPDAAILQALEVSLDNMARGGIYDQVGGGFHRYSTDESWLVPHFEKMLYNQAHLSRAYLGAYGLTGDRFYERTARQTLDYVLREMTSPEGVFYSATDADSEGEEGLFFLWTEDELHATLDKEDAELVIDLYGVTPTGNFEGSNILNLPRRIEDYAAENDLGLDRLLPRVDAIRERLWQAREQRIHPIRDDKTLLAWNGMMITAYSAAAMALDDSRYLAAGRKAAEVLWSKSRRREGRFWRTYIDGKTSIPAMQEDYAYYAEGLLGLFDATGEKVWLDRAEELVVGMVEQFWDDDGGGFFISGDEIDRHLIARPKTPHDGAIPSGNSVALGVLAKLYARTGEIGYHDRGSELLSAFSSGIVRSPAGHAYMLRSASQLLQGETGSLRYAASGHVRLRASVTALSDGALDLVVDLEIDDGWHVNSSQPLQAELLALEVAVVEELGWRLEDLSFPEPAEITLGFQDEALSVYQGDVRVQGRLVKEQASSPWAASVELRVQACNDELCLRPETLRLQVSVPGVL